MGKSDPEELWRRHALELFEAFKQSGELKKLRKEGLAACGRKKLFTSLEWAKSPMRQRYLSPRYMDWHHKCESVAQRFGLAIWTVECACLISGYQPEKEPFPIEAHWPQIKVVTENVDDQFLARLAYEAQRRGLHIVVRQGSVETIYLFTSPIPLFNLEPPTLPPSMPPLDNAFHMRVELPIGYPSQATKRLNKAARQLERELLTSLGYSISQRLRVSRLISKVNGLRIAERQLPKRGLYEIVAKTSKWASATEDERRRRTVKTQRHRLRKRLVKPYEASES